jgi:exonuclease III
METLTICTWNIWFDYFMKPERIPAAMREIQETNVDVICLQEVTPSILEIINSCPIVNSYFILKDNSINTSTYENIFLLHKRFEKEGIIFKCIPFPQSKMNRKIYQLTIHKRMTILNVHLESEFSNSGSYKFPPIKYSQLLYLFDYAKQIGGHVVIAGDCNIGIADEPIFDELVSKNNFTDLHMGVMTYDSKTNDNIKDNYVCRLDRVLCNNFSKCEHYKCLGTTPMPIKNIYGSHMKVFPSDHYGLCMKISM